MKILNRRWRSIQVCGTLALVFAASSPAWAADPAATAATSRRIAVMAGYHGYNAPIFERALLPRGVQIDAIDGWLDAAAYADYGVVIIDGSLKVAKVEPCEFSAADLEQVQRFLDGGGTLVLMYQGAMTLNTEHGRRFLGQWMGEVTPAREGVERLRLEHPWIEHLKEADIGWVSAHVGRGLPATAGTGIIEIRPGLSILHHVRAGKGQIIYVGWDICRFRPETRAGITPGQERTFNDQMRILACIASELYPVTPVRLPQRVFFDHPYELEPARFEQAPAKPDSAAFRTHAPSRALPAASNRPLGDGPRKFVDAAKGDDAGDGSERRPWKTVQHGVGQLKAGETLVLRGGTYYEHVKLSTSGEPGKPVTIRAYPGELVIVDGGFREFQDDPATAWEPAAEGAAGEFRSTRTYPRIAAAKDTTNVLGRFCDSMQPLIGYRFVTDLRTDNPYWNIPSNVGTEGAVYCGPGVWFDSQTKRIHCRLAPMALPGLGDDNYQGETDPRKLALVVAGEESVFSILDARHVRLEDLVLRGSKGVTLRLNVAGDVVLDGLTIYGGRTGMTADYTQGLRAIHCAFRGIGAPWSFRSHLKYRSMEAQFLTAGKWEPAGNSDFEIAYCEFTDSVDGVFIGNVVDARFHHNLMDNVTDDGILLTAMASNSGEMPGGPILIYQNRISRCLTAFAYGTGHGRQFKTDAGIHTGRGVWAYRNVVDLREPVLIGVPTGADQPQALNDYGRSQGDHGSPIWEPMFFYHNTIVASGPAWRNYYLHGWGGHANSTVRVLLNNIVAQTSGVPGAAFQDKPIALMFDGNLHSSLGLDAAGVEAFRAGLPVAVKRVLGDRPHDVEAFPTKLRHPLRPDDDVNPVQQLLGQASQEQGVPLRGQHDRCGEAKFVRFSGDWREAGDYRLQEGSAAVDAGVSIPADWPDPLRDADGGAADMGAIPLGHGGWRVGVGGRWDGAAMSR